MVLVPQSSRACARELEQRPPPACQACVLGVAVTISAALLLRSLLRAAAELDAQRHETGHTLLLALAALCALHLVLQAPALHAGASLLRLQSAGNGPGGGLILGSTLLGAERAEELLHVDLSQVRGGTGGGRHGAARAVARAVRGGPGGEGSPGGEERHGWTARQGRQRSQRSQEQLAPWRPARICAHAASQLTSLS